ncbi:MAG: hypothetical protein ACYC2K_05595 [Gemmatimonadales bacterium]
MRTEPLALCRQVGRATAIRIDHDGRDALSQQRQAGAEFAILEPGASVGMDVDEAGGNVFVLRIDDPTRRCLGKVTDRSNRIAADSDIAANPRVARAIEDSAVPDDQVKARLLGRRGPDQQGGEQQ